MCDINIKPEKGRNQRLDALRGVGALSVAVGHCATGTEPHPLYNKAYWQIDLTSPTDVLLRAVHVIFNADAAVLLFFVLSGHVLFQSLTQISTQYQRELFAYGIKRLFRIMPVLIIAILPFGLLRDWPWSTTIAYMLLLKPFGVTWTLQVEMIGSLLVFVGLLVWRWHPTLLIALFALTLIPSISTYPYHLLFALPAFILGCAIGPIRSFCRPVGVLFWSGLITLLFADLTLGKGPSEQILVVIGATLAIANAPAPAARFLDWRFFQWTGRLSYSLYLLHPLGVTLAAWAFVYALGIDLHKLPPLVGFAFLVLSSLTLTLILAELAHRSIEQPGIAAGRWLAQRLLEKSEKTPTTIVRGLRESAERQSG